METSNVDAQGIGHEDILDLAEAIAQTLVGRELSECERQAVMKTVADRVANGRDSSRRHVTRTLESPAKLTPPQLAKLWGVSPDKILTWIRSGELKATNIATDRSKRPRYLIDSKAIESFEVSRSVVPPLPTTRRKPKRNSGVIEFF